MGTHYPNAIIPHFHPLTRYSPRATPPHAVLYADVTRLLYLVVSVNFDKLRICIYMYAHMRTTLVLEDQLFRNAKQVASQQGTTLSEVVNRALRGYLLSKPAAQTEKAVFSMPVFGTQTTELHQTPQQLAELRDEGR